MFGCKTTPTATIVVNIGYKAFAIPFTLERMAALEDLMSNHVSVTQDWNNKISAINPKNRPDFSIHVLITPIPEWIDDAAETGNDDEK